VTELDTHARVRGPAGQDVQQMLPLDAVAAAHVAQHFRAVHVHGLVIPGERCPFDLASRLRIGMVELSQQVAPEHDAQAASRAVRAPFEDGDLVARLAQLQQEGGVETRGPAADACDPHCVPHLVVST
jgi:hypothetical protein